ncbi:hypothetical protein DM860_018160 [Cuscuta australis]|uniref:Uncharacterized protein n=1 Tax=Cuscuta australis TaxID=267555 RepID=A0A328E297_9ASTE|nr:hypothetical protein DM860_018160 [Cuscuta australis]
MVGADRVNHQNQELVATGKLCKAVPVGESMRRQHGRPAGSKNKPKPPIIIARDSANVLKAHAMEVSSGCGVNESLLRAFPEESRGEYLC